MEFEIAWLREHFPTPKPVRVHFVNYKKHFGGTWDCGEYYLIRIAKRLDREAKIDALQHEYAHCLKFDTYPDHSRSWACAYGRIYRKAHNE